MGRVASVPKRRGYQHYLFREIEEHHVSFLREFLEFIYGEYSGLAEYWSVLSRLLFNLPLVEIRKRDEEDEARLLTAFSIGELKGIHVSCRKEFEKLMERISRGERLGVKGMDFKICVSRLPSGEEVFWSGPGLPKIESAGDVCKEVVSLLLWSLMYLKRAAILSCKECSRYFLRSDIREAEYCSQICRYRAINRMRKEEREGLMKRRKRG